MQGTLIGMRIGQYIFAYSLHPNANHDLVGSLTQLTGVHLGFLDCAENLFGKTF
jgi:hypothetical protein